MKEKCEICEWRSSEIGYASRCPAHEIKPMSSLKQMNGMHERFDEKVGYCTKFQCIETGDILDFIESEIQLALAEREKEVVKELKQGLLSRMMKYDSKDGYSTIHDEVIEKVFNDVDDILSLISKNK